MVTAVFLLPPDRGNTISRDPQRSEAERGRSQGCEEVSRSDAPGTARPGCWLLAVFGRAAWPDDQLEDTGATERLTVLFSPNPFSNRLG